MPPPIPQYVQLTLTRAELLDALTTLATDKMMAGEWDSSWEINKSLDEFITTHEDTSIKSKSTVSEGDVGTSAMPVRCAMHGCNGVVGLNGAPDTKWQGFMECQRCGVSYGEGK